MNDDIKYAGFWRRWGALTIDSSILSIVSFIINLIFSILPEDSLLVVILLLVILITSYCGYFIYFNGSTRMATPGKIIAGIVVTDIKLQRISYLRSAGRFFATILSYLTLFIGFLICAFTKQKRCLHDYVAGTVVVDTGKSKPYFVLLVVIIIIASIASSFLLPSSMLPGGSRDFGIETKDRRTTFSNYFDPDDIKNLGKKAKIVSNNDVPVFEKMFETKVVPECKLYINRISPLGNYTPAPILNITSITDSRGRNILDKKKPVKLEPISTHNKNGKNNFYSGYIEIPIVSNKKCSHIYQIKGTSQTSVLQKVYVIELDTSSDIDVPYSIREDKNLILKKPDISSMFDDLQPFELIHTLNRDMNFIAYNKDNVELTQHLALSEKLSRGIRGRFDKSKNEYISKEYVTTKESFNTKIEDSVSKLVIEIPIKIKTKNIPFSLDIKPSKSLVPNAEIENFNNYLDLAIKGNPEAQYLVGYIYSQGKVVEKDIRKTIYWLQESSNNGFEKAKTALEQLQTK